MSDYDCINGLSKPSCNLENGVLKCHLPSDTIAIVLKVITMKVFHVYRKDYKSKANKCIPWGTEVRPYPRNKKENGRLP